MTQRCDLLRGRAHWQSGDCGETSAPSPPPAFSPKTSAAAGQRGVLANGESGRQVTATNESWTANIPAGGTVSFGLNGPSTQGTNGVPAAFTLNDTTCATVA
ncbi:cellulose binding domain-containing protein [Nonomuraea dietziae]|uniref:cellulose binding domain-containing protein n=1 Tax=Nonomuraea dietziae TaxID=65515 RepID=UPI003F4D132F